MDIFGNFSKLKGDKEKRQVRRKAELDFSYSDVALESVGAIDEKVEGNHLNIWPKIIVIVLFCVLALKTLTLVVPHGDWNPIDLAEGNRTRPRILDASRGLITDINGAWLARNEPSSALAVYPSDLPKNKQERAALFQKLADLSGMSSTDIQTAAEKNGLSSLDEVDIKENIPHDDALILEQKINGMPGVFIAKKPLREYQILPGLSHLIGYTAIVSPTNIKENPGVYHSSDKTGKTGIEAEYEQYLRGKDGVEEIEVNSKQNIVKVLASKDNQVPVSGNQLVLNIDAGLQQKTADALQAGIVAGAKLTGQAVTGGTAIVMDVNTGAVKAMVSLPDYNANLFVGGISNTDYQALLNDPSLPLFDRAIQGTYPPGSISKIILASAGLAVGTITKNTSIVTPAAIQIGDFTFPDWKDHSYESTNVVRAIAESNNVFFYSVGGGYDKIKGLGIDNIKKYWQLFGLGEKTGIDIPNEASGFLPDEAWKEKVRGEPWYIGDTYHVSIGQGDLLVTPLQMLRATAAIANGGTVLSPQLVNKIVAPDGTVLEDFAPRIVRQNVVPSDVIKTVQEGMRLTITGGSAQNLNDLPFTLAGKTGTAQFLNNEKTHAWFECYAPYEKPEIAIIVMVEGGGGGHEIAGPVAKDILSYYFANKK